MVNRVFLIGNLTRDPEIRYTPEGTPVCEFAIGVNRKYTDKKTGKSVEEASFIEIVAWQKTAENCMAHLTKGSRVHVEGRLRQDRWEDKKTGQKRSKVGVVANAVEFLDRKKAAPAAGPEPEPEVESEEFSEEEEEVGADASA